jgi:hypothetical protein
MKPRHPLFLIATVLVATLPLTLGLVRTAPVLADPPSGQQTDRESMQDAPPDITPYVRASIAAETPAQGVRPSISTVTASGAALRVIDTVINNTNSSLTNTDTQNDGEPSIAINPSNPNEIVITAFSGGWGADTPIWHSMDRGNTWTKEFSVPAPPNIARAAGCPCDQAVDFGRGNELSATFLTGGAPNPLDTYTGDTSNPVSSSAWKWLTSAGTAQLTDINAPGNIDQPWLLVGEDTAVASQDDVYVAYDDFNGDPDERVSVSLGSTPPDFVRDNLTGHSGGSINPGHRLAVDAGNGFVYSLFQQSPGSGAGGSKNINYMLNRSTDSGQTWTLNGSSTGIVVTNGDSTQPTPKFGTVNALLGGVLHGAVDPNSHDVYYVYGNRDSGTGNNRLSIIRLTDNGSGGLTIGSPVFVTGQVQAALPSVAVASDGTVGVLYDTYDGMSSGLPQFTAHFTTSADHGATFTDNTLLTFLSSATDNGNTRQRVLGDYQQVKALGKSFYGAFTANGAPLGRPFANHDAIFFCMDLCTIIPPANVSVSNTPGQCGAVVDFAAPSTSGNCGAVTTLPASGSTFPVGTTTVTCSSPGVHNATFTVTVNDTEPPKITCPANVVVVAPPGSTSFVVNYSTPVATDNCGTVNVVCVPASGSVFPAGVTTVTCTATDGSGNQATCTFSVTVYNVCLKDDATGNYIQFSSTTGDYRFIRCSTGATLTGKGSVQKVNGIITLTDTKPDRRITASYLTNQLTGHASVTIILSPGISQTYVINQTNTHAICSC